jgi:hypothetical protein
MVEPSDGWLDWSATRRRTWPVESPAAARLATLHQPSARGLPAALPRRPPEARSLSGGHQRRPPAAPRRAPLPRCSGMAGRPPRPSRPQPARCRSARRGRKGSPTMGARPRSQPADAIADIDCGRSSSRASIPSLEPLPRVRAPQRSRLRRPSEEIRDDECLL